jgi:hypothetical protein
MNIMRRTTWGLSIYWPVHKDLKPGTVAAPLAKAWFSSHPCHGLAAFAAPVRAIAATHVAQLDPCELLPAAFARLQCRGLGRQALQVQPLGRPSRQALLAAMAAVEGGALPDEDHLAGDLAPQVFETRDDVIRIAGAVLAGAGHLALWRHGADGGEMSARPPRSPDGGLPHRRIGAHHTGQGMKTGLVYEEAALWLLRRPFLMAGQVGSRQGAMAASSR